MAPSAEQAVFRRDVSERALAHAGRSEEEDGVKRIKIFFFHD
jgi:hypothetical protein